MMININFPITKLFESKNKETSSKSKIIYNIPNILHSYELLILYSFSDQQRTSLRFAFPWYTVCILERIGSFLTHTFVTCYVPLRGKVCTC